MAQNYRDSGVDIEAGDQLVDWLVEKTPQYRVRPQNIKDGIGGFASIYRMPSNQMRKPCLVSSTDGVGTKLKLTEVFGSYEAIAQDLVGMCVNDLVCTGATPLYFLDYYATGKLENKKAQLFLKGLFEALKICECDLIGGETAEMPGVYGPGDFDCAGFATGVVDEDSILGPHLVKVGDVVLGLRSSGFHSNGFSLIRKVFKDDLESHRDILIEPTRLYAPFVKECLGAGVELHALAHITGGGVANLPRVLPQGVKAQLETWEIPAMYREVQRRGSLTEHELYQVLNCGIGMMVVIPEKEVQRVKQLCLKTGDSPLDLGRIVVHDGKPRVELAGMVFE